MAQIVSMQDPGRLRADIHVMTRGFMGRREPLCDERGEPINFAPDISRCWSAQEARRRIDLATARAERACHVATRLEAL